MTEGWKSRTLAWIKAHVGPPRRTGDWLLWGCVIGLLSGLVAVAFFWSLEATSHLVSGLTGFHPPSPAGEGLFKESQEPASQLHLWLLAVMPAIGGLFSGILVYSLAPEAEGHGTDAMIKAFHTNRGIISPIVPLIKGVATLLTLGSGGSAGREGPIAQIGAGAGSWIGQKLNLRARDVRVMLLAGTAGGLGAIFRAPLGGAMTAIEVLYREDFESDAFIPCVLSSVTAYALFCGVFGHQTIFQTQRFSFPGISQFPFYGLLALICLPVGAFYCRFFYGARDRFFKKLPMPRHLRPAVGGLMVGAMVLAVPQVYGAGWGYLQQAINGNLAIGLMLALSLLKILATTFTISSGGSGGVFGPTLFIGGMLGGVVGYGAHALFPGVVDEPGAFVLVGMAALFSGVAHAPLGALLMITEMTGGYALVPPLMLVSAFAILFSKRWSIYENQIENKFHSPAHLSNMMVNVLQKLRVRDALRPEPGAVLKAGTSLRQIRQIFHDEHQLAFPVVDGQEHLLGTITLSRIRQFVHDPQLDLVVVAADLITDSVECHLDEDLFTVLTRMMESRCPQIPVTARDAGGKLEGMLGQTDIMAVYYRRMLGQEPGQQKLQWDPSPR
jgi:chloride channel protein, CIC family